MSQDKNRRIVEKDQYDADMAWIKIMIAMILLWIISIIGVLT
jgi:hypothetical protein